MNFLKVLVFTNKTDVDVDQAKSQCSINLGKSAIYETGFESLSLRHDSSMQALLPGCLQQSIGETRGRPILLVIGAGSQRNEELDECVVLQSRKCNGSLHQSVVDAEHEVNEQHRIGPNQYLF